MSEREAGKLDRDTLLEAARIAEECVTGEVSREYRHPRALAAKFRTLAAQQPDSGREAVLDALHRLCHLKQIKQEIEADSSDVVKTMSLQAFYDRNKDEAWDQAFRALKNAGGRNGGQDISSDDASASLPDERCAPPLPA